jgi:hypothetical protein
MFRATHLVGFGGRRDIIRQGLQLYLDAGDPRSYPGSGQVWTDLSPNGYTVWLGTTSGVDTTDPTFNAGPPAAFDHDGGDYFQFSSGYSGSIMRTFGRQDKPFSLFAIAKRGATASHNDLWFWGNGVGAANNVALWFDYTSDKPDLNVNITHVVANTQMAASTWKMIGLTGQFDGSTCTWYSNDVADGTFTYNNTGWTSGDSNNAIMYLCGAGDIVQSGHKTGAFLMYDRVLSGTEVSQIYNFFKGRFGI